MNVQIVKNEKTTKLVILFFFWLKCYRGKHFQYFRLIKHITIILFFSMMYRKKLKKQTVANQCVQINISKQNLDFLILGAFKKLTLFEINLIRCLIEFACL